MRIIEPGHIYEFANMDFKIENPKHKHSQQIEFLNREEGKKHPGIQTQDVIRAAINRTQHCDRCLRWEGNDLIIYHLRMALVLHEARALIRKVEKEELKPELVSLNEDGHFTLTF
jgi:hypothetical protein